MKLGVYDIYFRDETDIESSIMKINRYIQFNGLDESFKRCESEILKSDNPDVIYKVARDVGAVDVKAFSKKMASLYEQFGIGYKIYVFAKDVKGADIPSLEIGLYKSAQFDGLNHFYYEEFMKKIPGADKNVIDKYVIEERKKQEASLKNQINKPVRRKLNNNLRAFLSGDLDIDV